MVAEALLLILLPVLMAICAVGAVLALKIARRRTAIAPHLDAAVPVVPMTAPHARRLVRRYLWSSAAALGCAFVLALALTAAR